MSDLVMGVPTAEQLNEAVQIAYVPFMNILSNTQEYAEKISNMKMIELKGNEEEMLSQMSKAKVSNNTTEIEHFKAGKSTKTFKKAFYITQYQESEFDEKTAIPDMSARSVRVGSIQMDRDVWSGAINDGFFVNSQAEYKTNAPATITIASSTFDDYNSIFAKLRKQIKNANSTNRIIFALYGKTAEELAGKTLTNSGDTYLSKLKSNFSDCDFVEVPAQVESSNNGVLVIADDLVKLHYTAMPRTLQTGVNDEKHYKYIQTIVGSAMVELKEDSAIVKQPITFS